MRKLSILKAIVDLLWYITILTIIGIMIFTPIFLTSNDPSTFNILIKNVTINTNQFTSAKFFIIPLVIAQLLICISIYYFRKIITNFKQLQLFTNDVIKNLNKVGMLICVAGGIFMVTEFLIRLIFKGKIGFEISTNSNLFLIAFGMFFLVLSEIFKISNQLKEENELTI